MAKKRGNVVTIIENPFRPQVFQMLVGKVDVLIAHVDHLTVGLASYVPLNAMDFLGAGGHYLISIKTNGSASSAEAVFEASYLKPEQNQFKPMEQVPLDPFDKDRTFITGGYRMPRVF